mmetsp:Transcript_53258/g.173170  ORF Transcript_53258/g.173170 Transcript_53258/m.173170 type:complete len:204 (+) Transcript_53258:167-778(+)
MCRGSQLLSSTSCPTSVARWHAMPPRPLREASFVPPPAASSLSWTSSAGLPTVPPRSLPRSASTCRSPKPASLAKQATFDLPPLAPSNSSFSSFVDDCRDSGTQVGASASHTQMLCSLSGSVDLAVVAGSIAGHLAPIVDGIALLEESWAGRLQEVSAVRARALAFAAKQEADMAALRVEVLAAKRRRVRIFAPEVFEFDNFG